MIRQKTDRGEAVEFQPEPVASGTMKDVHRTASGADVVAVFREPLGEAGRARIEALIDMHRPRILEGAGGAELAELYRWPRDTLTWNGRFAILVPAFQAQFLFGTGSVNNDMLGIRGREKEGKWFASAHHRQSFLDPSERGTWVDYLRISISIARAVRRLHAAGVAHSDLSYKNVLVDPISGTACIIDIDGLVVPGKYPPDVVGTPDFIAPEVVAGQDLPVGDPARIMPSIDTDRHALAVLIYMYLLGRHPLQGGKIHDPEDTARDEMLAMGPRALWIEHPEDASNRVDLTDVRKTAMPWADTGRLPHTICGPLLAPLFRRAFVDGLHDPARRPTADEWERALILTTDLLLPTGNPSCEMGSYVYDGSAHPRCPLCATPPDGPFPLLNLYSSRGEGSFRPDGHRVVIHEEAGLYRWHESRFVMPTERLSPEEFDRLARVERRGAAWWLVNERLPDLRDLASGETIALGGRLELRDGAQILLSTRDGGRIAQVQMANRPES
ncbi:MAG: lipopolysaccharide kinase InaA family protein [Pseudomonadota bacterium]